MLAAAIITAITLATLGYLIWLFTELPTDNQDS